MKTHYTLISLLILTHTFAQKDTIKGTWAGINNKEIRLLGFTATKDSLLANTTSNAKGDFVLSYPSHYKGAASLQVKDGPSLTVLLQQHNTIIHWDSIPAINTLHFINSPENEAFYRANQINQNTQQKLAGWQYLLPLYNTNKETISIKNTIENQIKQLNQELPTYMASLPKDSYAKHYINYQLLLQEMSLLHQKEGYQPEIATQFNALDLSSSSLQHSGLLVRFLTIAIENTLKKQDPDALDYLTDTSITSTKNNPKILNDISEYLFKYYEQYKLTAATQHLALSLLSDNKCVLYEKTTDLLEQYRSMAVGKQAPDLTLSHSNKKYQTLYEIQSKYKVVFFGASWCEECQKELPQLKEYLSVFKEKYDANLVFIALDSDLKSYQDFTQNLDAINSCDLLSWNGDNVKKYYIAATPSFYILDSNNTIVAKPTNAIDAAKWLYEASGK
jgi:peroxiredoxin